MMKILIKSVIVLFLFVATAMCGRQSEAARDSGTDFIRGRYLGMEPPRDAPELFAPGVVADVMTEHSAAIFSPDGRELFWSVVTSDNPGLHRWIMVHMERTEGVWSPPRTFFLAEGLQSHVHSISPDGMRLYFSLDGEVLVSEKGASGWTSPQPLSRGIKPEGEDQYVFDLQEATSGSVYFVSQLNQGPRGWGIFVARRSGGGYEPPEALGRNINSGHEEETPYIDPEERFILFSSIRPGGYGGQDLYVSFRQDDGSWGKGINLGKKVNSSAGERYPRISPDGEYLFFVSTRTGFASQEDFERHRLTYPELKATSTGIKNGLANIYWVRAEFLENLSSQDEG